MKQSADYESDNGAIRVRPNMLWNDNKEPTGELAYITIFSTTSKVNINASQVTELREMLEAVEQRYIKK